MPTLPASRPATGTLVPTSVGEVHVEMTGDPTTHTVVLLHGFTASLRWYDALTALLAPDHRVVRLDLLGHGSSVASAGRFDSRTQARAVDEALKALGVGPYLAVGHSFGGDVAVGLAERSADVGGLVLLAQAPDYTSARLPRGRHLAALPVVRHAARHLMARAAEGQADGQYAADVRALDPRALPAVIVDRARDLAARPLDVRLADLGLPRLVVLGARDPVFPMLPSYQRYAAVPGVRVEVLADGRHNLIAEHPDRVAALLRRFLQEIESD